MSKVAWYYATSPRATFGFEVADGKIISVAPYGRSWLLGKPYLEVLAVLKRHGFTVQKGG